MIVVGTNLRVITFAVVGFAAVDRQQGGQPEKKPNSLDGNWA